MRKYLKSFVIILLCIMGLQNIGYSQSNYKVKETKDIDIKLLGTSTFKDWEMDSQSSYGEAKFIFKPGCEKDLASLEYLTFAINVTDLKSDNDKINENAYEALKSNEYKEIRYRLTSSTIVPKKGGYLVKSNGYLTIAGVTKKTEMDVHAVINDDGSVTTKGVYKLKMTDYNVEPPTFFWGVMKTGNVLTLDFTIVYVKNKS